MQNPDELIMLFENPSSNTHAFSDRQVRPLTLTHTTHTQAHMGHCLAPSLHDMFSSVPSYSLVRMFHRKEGKEREHRGEGTLRRRRKGKNVSVSMER